MPPHSPTDHPVHELIAARWSPVAFDQRAVERDKLMSVLEAARWAPSSYNEQPWTFLVGDKTVDPDGFGRLFGCIVPGNGWAQAAPVLILSIARMWFARNEKPNRHAFHDVGLATENLVLQAESLGLKTHQMAGFDADKARADLAIPAGHEPVAMTALGYHADPVPADLAARESGPRSRKAMDEIIRGAGWDARFRDA